MTGLGTVVMGNERKFELSASDYRVGLNVDEIKEHKDKNGYLCEGKRGKIMRVEVISIYETDFIKCETCGTEVTMGK